MWKRILLVSTLTMLLVLVGCSNDKKDNGEGSVYYLNFKPEIADDIEALAKEYEEETGVKVKVVTAAQGTYESTLTAEVAKSDPPTVFFINGPVGYKNWADYTLDLSDSKIYDWLLDKDMAISNDDGVFGLPIAVEGYGIIYNKAIFNQYFDSANKTTDVASVEEINNFATLQAVVEDMTAMKDELGIEGVFSSTSLAPGDDWRWQTHLANIPVYYEYKDKEIVETDELEFTYEEQFANIFDLYLNNSVVASTLLGSKTTDDSMTEFALGQSAMVQNGNWAWGQIANVDGNIVNEEDIGFLPIYTGVDGEEKQGIAIGTENYLAFNSQADEKDLEASMKFVEWMFESDTGKEYAIEKFGFIPTFSTFGEDEVPTDPLAKAVIADMESDTYTIDWNFITFPSETFKNEFGNALLLYAQEQASWEDVVDTVVEAWAKEASLAQ